MRTSTRRSTQIEIQKFFASEGVAAVITASSIREDVRVSGYYDQKWHTPFASFVFSREHYGRLILRVPRLPIGSRPFQKVRANVSLTTATGAPVRSPSRKGRPRTIGIRIASK